jgi:phage N-6-adenine-methyltransferase
METNIHFSSKTDKWETPQDLFDTLNEEFNFTLDVCALPENAKCKKFFTPKQNGLIQNWNGRCWMNPPYGREIGKWMKKAYESHKDGTLVVCLIPSRTDTKWWHNYAMKGEIRFIKGRLKFGGAKNSAPFPSAIVIFNNKVR